MAVSPGISSKAGVPWRGWMVLEKYRSGWQDAMTPLAQAALSAGLTPNVVSAVSLLFALAGGVAFAFASPAMPGLLVVGCALAGANAIADGLDGRMARLAGSESRRGDYLDHVIDRYADLALLLGLVVSPYGHTTVGIFAIVGTSLTSYMGTQAQALGLGRNYRGLLGRADRVVLVATVPAIEGFAGMAGYAVPLPFTLVTALLAWFAFAGNVTALQRFWQGWRELDQA